MPKGLELPGCDVTAGNLRRREFLGRAMAFGAAAAIANPLLAITARAQTLKKGGHLKMGLVGGASSDSLDPATWLTAVPLNFGHTWGECLVLQSPEDGSAMPILAESWEASGDADKWRFKIRRGVTFHNGKEMTAEDVAQSIRRHTDENTKSAALGLLTGIEEVAVDGDGVVIKLENGNVDLPLLLADVHLVIQPNGGFDAPDSGIGTGPYKMEVNEPGVRHVSTRYAGYWNDERGHVDSVEIIVMNDTTARMAALQSGQVHIINHVEPKTVEMLAGARGIVIERVPSKGHYTFPMRVDTPPFDNADLRLALKLAIDREAMTDRILRGHGTIGNDFPINNLYALFPEDVEQRTYDPDKAAFHFKKSGHSGPILLHTSEVAFPGAVDAATLFKLQAAKAGITLDIRREPGDGYWSQVWNKQPFCASYWGGQPTQNAMYSTAYISGAPWNDTRFFHEDFDKLIMSARAEFDQAKRAEMYRDAALMVRNDGGTILPMFNDLIDAHHEKVKGWVKDPINQMSNFRAALRVWLDNS